MTTPLPTWATPPLVNVPTVDSREAFDEFRAKYGPIIADTAKRLAGGDDALWPELLQVGFIVLWRLDPSRFSEDDVALLLLRIRDRMKHARRGAARAFHPGGHAMISVADIEAFEADATEPPSMRRARAERWNPQDPCTEHL